MGPGFKYHVITISAIFFALTVGLIVGSLFVSPRLANRQERAINALRATLSADNAAQKQRIRRYEEFLARMTPVLLQGKLNGFAVAIVQTGDYPEATAAAREALEMAGATVLSTTVIERFLDRPDEVLHTRLSELRAGEPRMPLNRGGVVRAIAQLIARGDSAANPLLPALAQADILQPERGSSYLMPARAVVVVGGSRVPETQRPSRIDQPLIEALQKQGVTVLLCEGQDAAASDVGAYQALDLDVATVDNVDTEMGQCALVFALKDSAEKENYGIKATARQLVPSSLARSIP